jgi:hypothetical protein
VRRDIGRIVGCGGLLLHCCSVFEVAVDVGSGDG